MTQNSETRKMVEYKRFAMQFLQEHYSLKLPIPIKINGRLKRTCGRFAYDSEGKPLWIELSRTFIHERSDDEVLDVLKHELIHYALFVLGKPCKDSARTFQDELRKHGVSSTRSYRYHGKIHLYRCNGCGREFTRIRRISHLNRKRCAACKNTIQYVGEVHQGEPSRSLFS